MIEKKIPDKMFANVPLKLALDMSVTDKAVRIYHLISNLANAYGCCYAKNQYFMNAFEIDESTVSRCLAQLKDKGYIKVSMRGRSRIIELPINATFQTNDSLLSDEEKEIAPEVLEIVKKIEDRQKEKYPGLRDSSLGDSSSGAIKDIILTTAKAVYNSEYIGTKMGGLIVTEEMMKDLVEIIDIGDLVALKVKISENLDDIFSIDRYILASLIYKYKAELKEKAADRKLKGYLNSKYEN